MPPLAYSTHGFRRPMDSYDSTKRMACRLCPVELTVPKIDKMPLPAASFLSSLTNLHYCINAVKYISKLIIIISASYMCIKYYCIAIDRLVYFSFRIPQYLCPFPLISYALLVPFLFYPQQLWHLLPLIITSSLFISY